MKKVNATMMTLTTIVVVSVMAVSCKNSEEKKDKVINTPKTEIAQPASKIAETPSKEIGQEKIYSIDLLDKKPTFQNGDIDNFTKWVNNHLVYPEDAKKNDITGRLTASFTIETDGSLSDIKILNPLYPSIDSLVLKVIRGTNVKGYWTAGMVDEKPVKSTLIFPVIFQLK